MYNIMVTISNESTIDLDRAADNYFGQRGKLLLTLLACGVTETFEILMHIYAGALHSSYFAAFYCNFMCMKLYDLLYIILNNIEWKVQYTKLSINMGIFFPCLKFNQIFRHLQNILMTPNWFIIIIPLWKHLDIKTFFTVHINLWFDGFDNR